VLWHYSGTMILHLTLLAGTGDPNSPTNTLISIAVVAGIGFSVWAIKKALPDRRTEAWKTSAQGIGFTYEGDDWIGRNSAPLLETALFGKGHEAQFKNITTGARAGLRVSLFDFSYSVRGVRGSGTVTQTVGTYSKNGVYNPYFQLWPGDTFDKVLDKVTHKNIYFESNPEFARHFVLRSPSEDKIRALFTPALLTFLEQPNSRAGWVVEGAGDTIVIYCPGWKAPPAELRSFLDRTSLIANNFFSLANCHVIGADKQGI
jgi:hypothetical protein